MKKLCAIITCMLLLYTAAAQSGRVDNDTKEFIFKSSLADQYMFYGYASPDKRSEKLILFSVYPSNISNNAMYKYPLGSYHETTGIKDGEKIIYVGSKKGYAEMQYIDANNNATTFYIRQGYVHSGN